MRHFLFALISVILVLFTQPIYAYDTPPIREVMGNNSIAAVDLDGYYNSSVAQNGTITLQFGSYQQILNLSASVEIIGLSPTVDNMSCAYDGLSVMLARGYTQGHLISLPFGYSSFYCNQAWWLGPREFSWPCDFDGDDCAEYENQAGAAFNLNVTFSFRNKSASVPFSSTLIEVPETILNETQSASGAEFLNVSITGPVTFSYEINDRHPGFGGECGSNYSNMSKQVSISLNHSFLIGGEKKLFFLRAPVLREQWFRNNHFDVIVLSQCPIYHASTYLNGNITKNFTLKNFSISEDHYGFHQIISNMSNSSAPDNSGWSESNNNVTSPFTLELENNSFRYVYEFNSSYIGLGKNNLSLVVSDVVLASAWYNDTILSRMLSYNGSFAEDGSSATPTTSRPSISFSPDSLLHFEIGFGLIACILILAFVNFWLLE